jgi:hypothetical protein
VAFGPDAIATIKEALEVKKGPSPVFEIVLNPKKISNLAKSFGAPVPEGAGAIDALIPFWAVSIEGGTELRLKISTNLKGFEGVGVFGLPLVPVKKEFKQELKK